MTDSKNLAAVRRAGDAVCAFLETGGGDPGSMQDTLTDLLTDLRHWAAHQDDVNFELAVHRARNHFAFEQNEAQ